MIARFDRLNRFEVPSFTLCSPGSIYVNGAPTREVGILVDTSDEELVLNFNAMSELNLRVTKVRRDDAEANAHTLALYKAIQNRRLLFVDDIGYFMITSVVDGYDEAGFHYKDITAKSCEAEIQNKMLPYIADGTYAFTNLLETVVASLPLWRIGTVDDTITAKHRTFEDVSTEQNILSFMLENMQDAFECIFVFDCIERLIHVYDQNQYVRRTNIHITKQDLINSIDISENSDDVYTVLNVLGDENLNIAPINPLGTNLIYNFDYYLDWMSKELRTKVEEWKALVADNTDRYYDLNLDYYHKLTDKSNLQANLDKVTIQMTLYRRCRDNIVAEAGTDFVGEYNDAIVANGGTPITIDQEIDETLAEIDTLLTSAQAEYDVANARMAVIEGELHTLEYDIEAIHDSLAVESFFTTSETIEGEDGEITTVVTDRHLLDELANYMYEGSYLDEYVSVTDIMTHDERFAQMKILYDRACGQLERASYPSQEFSLDVENFIFAKEFAHWSEQLATGCLINVELDVDDIALLFLSNMTVNYDDRTLTMTFGNRFNKFDPKSLFDNVLGDISKSSNTLHYIKDILYPIKNGEFNKMKEALQTSRNLSMSAALSSDGERVVIDGSGYTGRKMLENGTYDPRQVKLTGKNLVFTDDAWETCKVAIGEILFGNGEAAYGVNAETIIGDVIMGRNLRIVDSDGNDLLTIVDGKIMSQVKQVNDAVSRIEQTANNVKISVTDLESKIGKVDHVRTTTGYTFDADGLTIAKDGQEIKNLLDNTGMFVTRSGKEVLTANKDGVVAINLTARQYLTIGSNSRFENYSNGTDTKRTACFYIGSEF